MNDVISYIKKIFCKKKRNLIEELLYKFANIDYYEISNQSIRNQIIDIYNQIELINPEYLKIIDCYKLKSLFKNIMGYELNINNPKTYNEKLQWLKIHNRKQIMTDLVDKYKVRNYVKKKGLENYLNEIYGVYNSSIELINDLNNLTVKFVAKVNHWSGEIIIVNDKNDIEITLFKKLDELLLKNYYFDSPLKNNCEWPYKNIKPCIIVEKYLEENDGKLLDYKIFCFDGRPHYIQIDVDRHTNHTRCLYNLKWEKQPFTTLYPYYNGEIPKPKNLEEMLFVAEKLSEGFPHVRVDLYNINQEKIIFGELTFYHGSGFEKFYPDEWDLKFGELITVI